VHQNLGFGDAAIHGRRLLLRMSVLATLASCAPDRPPAMAGSKVDSPSLVIRVDDVHVTQRRGGPWDAPRPELDFAGAGCELFGATAGGALGGEMVGAKAIPFLCKAIAEPPSGTRPSTLPDIQLRLSGGVGTGYVTDVVRDVDRWSFREQSFVVPLDAIPTDGLLLEVSDDDWPEGSDLIGAVRLYREELLHAAGGPAFKRSASFATFELVVTRYEEAAPQTVNMGANEGTRDARLPIAAGEVVRVTAAGQYQIGGLYRDTIGPTGYPGGGPQRDNFKQEPLASAPNGAAFVLVGGRKRLASLATPCSAFVSPVGGPLIVGINDADPANNSGAVSYVIERRAPTAEEWQRQRTGQLCP
jgi:hypothetical protein